MLNLKVQIRKLTTRWKSRILSPDLDGEEYLGRYKPGFQMESEYRTFQEMAELRLHI